MTHRAIRSVNLAGDARVLSGRLIGALAGLLFAFVMLPAAEAQTVTEDFSAETVGPKGHRFTNSAGTLLFEADTPGSVVVNAGQTLTLERGAGAPDMVVSQASMSIQSFTITSYQGAGIYGQMVYWTIGYDYLGQQNVSHGFSGTINPPAGTQRVTFASTGGSPTNAQVSVTLDSVVYTLPPLGPLTVALTSASPNPVNAAFTVTATFNRPVTGLTAGDFSVTNGSASSLSGSGASYTVTITPAADGAVTVGLPANVAQDTAGNQNAAATDLTRTADITPPSVSLASAAGNPVSGAFPVTITFSESVTGFAAGDLSLTNATASEFAGSGTSYTVTITPAADGAVTVGVPANVAQDGAGNQNTAATNLTRTADITPPSVTLASASGDPVSGAFPVTITFSESVTGFAVGNLSLTNATASNFAGSGASYTVTITPAADGAVTVGVPANVAQDAAGNQNTASNSLTRQADTVRPDVTLASASGDPTNGAFSVTATFTKPVTGLVLGYFAVTNGSASGLTGSGASYAVTITPTGDGVVSVSLPDGAAQDAAGNTSTASNTLARQIDTARPGVTLASASSDPANGAFTVSANFTKSVTGLVLGDFAVTNGSASGLTGSGDSYSVTITPIGDGVVSVSLPDGIAQDAAGNTSTASNTLSRQIDTARPGVTLASTSSDPTNGAFTVSANFTKSVTGLVLGDFAVTNGSASGLTGSGDSYSVTITPTGDGAVSVSLPEAAASDAAGNTSTASNALTRQIDTARPGVTLSSTSSDPVSGAFPVTITFSENVTGFVAGDLSLVNATVSGFAGSGAVYTVTVTPAADGTVTVGIPANVAQDAAGNQNTASNVLTRQIDSVRPGVTLASTSTNPTNGPFTVTATFTKPVTGLLAGDFSVNNGTASGLTGSGASYSVTITPGGGGSVEVSLPDGAASDAAGNASTASNVLTRQIDSVRPGVTLASASADPANGAFTVTATFTKPVTGLALGDFSVTNATASDLTGSGTSYTMTITPIGDGAVAVSLPEGAASDTAGNTSTASNVLTRQVDTVRPGLVIATASSTPVTGAFPVTFSFSKPVTGFAQSDVSVTNGALSGFSGSGSEYTGLVTPQGDGPVVIAVAEGAGQDTVGNASLAASLSVEAKTSAPRANAIAVSSAMLGLGDVGRAFTITVSFAEAMDVALPPVIGFSGADLTGTLSFQSGAFSQGGAVYTAQYAVADAGLEASAIGVTASGARDVFGNMMAPAVSGDLFSVDMRRAALTVSVSVEGLTDGAFAFTGDLGAFSIATVNQAGSTVFSNLAEGVYTVTMAAPDGFSAGAVACAAGAGTNLGDGQLELSVSPGLLADCRFTAIADSQIDEDTIAPVTLALSTDGAGDLAGVSAPLPLTNTGGAPLAFSASTDVNWLSVAPASGTIPAAGTIELELSFTEAVLTLAPGSHVGNVLIETGPGAGSASAARRSSSTSRQLAVPVNVVIEPREGTISLVATTAPMQAGDAVFTYASNIAAFDALALETVNGTASSPSATVLEGVYQIVQSAPAGWRVSDISCTGGTATTNPESGQLSITLAAEQNVVCTFANVRDEDYVRQVTSGAIRAFMAARADRILSTSPGLIDRLRRPGRGQSNRMRFDMTEGHMKGALDLSLSAMRSGPQRHAGSRRGSMEPVAGFRRERMEEHNPGYQRGGPVNGFGVEQFVWTEAEIQSEALRDWRSERASQGSPEGLTAPLQGAREARRDGDPGFDIWMTASWSSARDDRAGQRTRSTFGIMHIGVDQRLGEDLLVGALVQIDQMDARAGELDSRIEGTGWMAGPYAAARLGSNLYWSGRAAYGRSDNDINPLGLYTDAFRTSRWLFETALAGDIELGSWRVTPEATLTWFEETQDSYVDTLGIDMPAQSISLGRLRAGPEIAYRASTPAGGYVEPFVRLMVTWDYDAASVFNPAGVLESLDDMRIDAALGVAARFANGTSLELRGHVDGLGAGQFRASTAQVRIRVPF